MKVGDIVQIIKGNSYYDKYLYKYAIIESIYLTDELKEITNIRIIMFDNNVYNNLISIFHKREKAYTFRLKVVS